MKFYICKTCGNIITKVKDSSVPVVCCGKAMEELVAGSVEARHGIILAKNEIAKSYGVKTAEAIWEAKNK